MISSDAPNVVHLITRAAAGCTTTRHSCTKPATRSTSRAATDLPYTFRNLARDHAHTEIFSYIVEAISREPDWHSEYFGLSDEEAQTNAEATTFLEALLFRRYAAKFGFELDFWRRFGDDGGSPDGYSERLTAATGIKYRSDAYLADMDAGFYSADYLRARCRSAQLREHSCARWAKTGGARRTLVTDCGSSSARARGPRARTSPRGSATTRWTPGRC